MANEMTVFTEKYLATIQRFVDHENEMKRLKEESEAMRKELMEAMDFYNIRSFDTDLMKATIVAPSVSTTIDTKALRMRDPDTYEDLLEEYPKTTERRQSIRITIK